MSHVFFGVNPETMAYQLGQALQPNLQQDPFVPIDIVVPNPYLGKWLRLQLARQLNILFNIRFIPFEQELWNMLRELDSRPQTPELLGGDLYRFLVLGVLLEYPGKELESLRAYLGRAEKDSPPWWRRAWNVSDRMSSLIRDYEYHRREAFILPWLADKKALPGLPAHDRLLERAQRTLFHEIIEEKRGRRTLLNATAGRNFKTLPQYSGELMEDIKPPRPEQPLRRVYLFGITQMSELHARTLAWLSGYFDLQCYFLSPLTPRLDPAQPEQLKSTLEQLRTEYEGNHALGLIRRWTRAGFESLWRLQQLIAPEGPLPWQKIGETSPKDAPTVLSSLQGLLLGALPAEKLGQDMSLQIVGCPGVQREVETVYESILHNLQNDPALRLTDIAVLVTDMESYRPALQARFDRDDLIRYSLIDHSAVGVSHWGQALLGMLDLAQENFPRSAVFEVLLNPSVLARLGIDRAQAQVWLHWAEELGAYHGWDAKERLERRQPANAIFAWRQALQRLRLGRYMDSDAEGSEAGVHFGNLVPHADIHSEDRQQLDAFCRAVEGLLPVLIHLRSAKENGRWWAEKIRFLSRTFLEIPEDRPAEGRVLEQLLATLEHLELWDDLHKKTSAQAKIPLALVREFVNAGLQGISASRGDPLVAGVTISALQPMRPVPFKIIYVLGMNETLFPGRNALSSLDLRSHAQREQGDILPAEQNLLLLLEVVLSARSKLYFFYNNRDLQKDEELLPAMPLAQLRGFLSEEIIAEEFQFIQDVPLHAHENLFHARSQAAFEDVLVTHGKYQRALAIHHALAQGEIRLSAEQQAQLDKWQKSTRRDFSLVVSPETVLTNSSPQPIRLKELQAFLENPALALLRRRLHIEEDRQEEEGKDDEPFVSGFLVRGGILQLAMRETIRRYLKGLPLAADDGGPLPIDCIYKDYQLRCQAPAGPFGELECLDLREEFEARLQGDEDHVGLNAFLQEHPVSTFQGPILLGEGNTPVGAHLHFPALELSIASADKESPPRAIRIMGHAEYVWWKQGESFDILQYAYSSKIAEDKLSKQLLEPLLFCLVLLAQDATTRVAQSGQKAGKQKSAASAISGREMLANTRWNIHFLMDSGLKTWTFEPGIISPQEAVAYLTNVAAEYVGEASFDLMPIQILTKDSLYESAVNSADEILDAVEFRSKFQEEIEVARESSWGKTYWDDPLLELINADVPEDALQRCQRRLHLLDRGLARLRAQAAEAKAAEKKPRAKKTSSEKPVAKPASGEFGSATLAKPKTSRSRKK